MTRRRIPVIVLSGGLGSGKTTLLNHLLRAGMGRIGVVINDFGDIDVDGFLVSGHVDAAASITGGCLCCLSDTSELDETLTTLTRPALDLDVVVIEASGLAEPRELARMVLSSPVRGVRFGGVVDLVDVAAWSGVEGELPVAEDRLRVASLVVLNKADRLAPDALDALERTLRPLTGPTPVLRTTFGRVDPALLFDALDRPEPTGQLSLVDVLREQDHHEHDHGHDHYVAASLDSPRPVDPRRLVAFLEEPPAGVYRVKGAVHVGVPGRDERYVVQAVGGWLAFERGPWPPGQEASSRLVAIGTGLDEADVAARLEACLADDDVPADHLHAMTRYVRRG